MARPSLTSTRSVIAARARAGTTRVRASLPKIVLATVGSVFSYWFAETVLHHPGPLFAATSALISLNFASTSYVRRTLEVAIGCTLGIAVGDLLLTFFGQGLWQAAVVVFVSLALSRFLDSGVVFSMQFGLQSLLVVLLPVPAGGPFTRSIDAVVGGLVALLLVMLWPKDPRRQPSEQLGSLFQQTGHVVRDLSSALVAEDSASAWHCLVQARSTQPQVDEAAAELAAADEMARLSPAARRHRGDIDRLTRMEVQVDLSIRHVRSLSRRIASLLSHHALSVREREDLAEALDGLADAMATLAVSVTTTSSSAYGHLTAQARDRLTEIAGSLDPAKLGGGDPQVLGVIMMLRPLCVDLLEAAGVRHDDAAGYLPKI